MANDQSDKPASSEIARATLANLKRMLSGEANFPATPELTAEMVRDAKPVMPAQPIVEQFTGSIDELVAAFEKAAESSEDGPQFWSAQRLMPLLGYGESWQNFKNVIDRAQIACHQSGHLIADHFNDVITMVPIVSGAERGTHDVRVTRYGAYLIAQNGDSRKRQVAYAQTYFATQTRRQELRAEIAQQPTEDQQRLMLRDQMAEHNKDLADAARDAGITRPVDFAVFQNYGYRGLYNGLDAGEIRSAKGLPNKAKILDHMGITELAANFFRATQAEQKLRREGIAGASNANAAHFEVGQKVRNAIRDIGGDMPETLPAEENIDTVRKRLTKADVSKQIK